MTTINVASALHASRHAPGGADSLSGAYEPKPQSGLLSARPAAATFGEGLYFATDVNGGTLYHSDGGAWTQWNAGVNPSGKVLGSPASSSADFTIPSDGVFHDVTSMTYTIPAGSAFRLKFTGALSAVRSTATTAAAFQLQAVDVATGLVIYLYEVATAALGTATSIVIPVNCEMPVAAALASDTPIKLQALVSTTSGLGTCKVFAGFGNKPYSLYALGA